MQKDDVIYRRSAIDELERKKDKNAKGEVGGFYNKIIQNDIDTLMQLPSAQPEQQWIPCSKKLPEEKDAGILKKLGTKKRSEYVLATVEVKGERMTVTACMHDGKWYWNMKYAFPDFEVVAWMPRPEPYKGRREK